MGRNIMIELFENTNVLETIEGFELDKDYTPIEMKDTYLFRGIAVDNEAIKTIEALSSFYALWDDEPIGPAGGFGPARCCDGPTNILAGRVAETSEKGEFELLLLFSENKGKNTEVFKKWVSKMDHTKSLPRPVYGKMMNELGNEYILTKTDEVVNIYHGISDKSRIKNFD